MKKCKVCGRLFRLKKENRYLIEKRAENILVAALSTAITYECFDCPRCGCQNVCNVREVNGTMIGGEGNASE